MKKWMTVMLFLCLLMGCSAAFASTEANVTAERIATRSGPGTDYTEPGSFLWTGAEVAVHTKAYDPVNEMYWLQVEFTSGGERYRAYTGDWRLNADLTRVPDEILLNASAKLNGNTCGYAGPGYDYHLYDGLTLYGSYPCQIIEVENQFVLIDTYGSNQGLTRAWVHLSCIDGGSAYDGQDTFPEEDGWLDDQGATLLTDDDDDQGAVLLSGYAADYPIGRTCVVWVESGNARTGAGTGYDRVAYVHYGDVLTVLDRKMGSSGKDWYQVCIDGRLCWISSGLVLLDGNKEGTVYGVPIVPVDELAEYPLTSSYLIGRWFRIDSSSAHVREKPDIATPTVGYVKEQQYYLILECRVGSTGKVWYKIEVDHEYGWISSGLGTVVK